MRPLLIAVVSIAFWQSASAKECTPVQARSAEAIAATRHTWQEIHAAYRLFAHCDDGAIAEGFTQSVVHHLASRWSALPEAERLFVQDTQFEVFVIKHIDASASNKELEQIIEQSTRRCPAGAQALCRKLEKAAREQ